MDFVREIIEPEKLAGVIDIPEALKQTRLEVIILPFPDDNSKRVKGRSKKKSKFKELYENPIKVDKVQIRPREQLHER